MTKQIQLYDQNGNELVVQAGESYNLLATFKDVADPPATLTKANILTLKCTLYAGTSVINSRSAQSVLDANDGTVTTAGALTLKLGPSDNVIKDSALDVGDTEQHVCRLTWTWSDGTTRTGIVEYVFDVEKIASPT